MMRPIRPGQSDPRQIAASDLFGPFLKWTGNGYPTTAIANYTHLVAKRRLRGKYSSNGRFFAEDLFGAPEQGDEDGMRERRPGAP